VIFNHKQHCKICEERNLYKLKCGCEIKRKNLQNHVNKCKFATKDNQNYKDKYRTHKKCVYCFKFCNRDMYNKHLILCPDKVEPVINY
jgi:type IV secretory pathway component VirB8